MVLSVPTLKERLLRLKETISQRSSRLMVWLGRKHPMPLMKSLQRKASRPIKLRTLSMGLMERAGGKPLMMQMSVAQ